MNKKTIHDIDIKGKNVLVRVDFNVPMNGGSISDDNRIVQALPTIQALRDKGGRLILLSHLGRIKEASDMTSKTLAPVAKRLAELLEASVVFVPATQGPLVEAAIAAMQNGDVVMIENTRFEDLDGKKESKNDPALGKYWASLGDVFVNDAFGTAHRAHASNVGIATHIKESAVGLLLEREIDVLSNTIDHPKRPFVAILGGAKISDKIPVIERLLTIADSIIVGGGMAYTFYKAKGYEVGTSLVELDKVEYAKDMLVRGGNKLILPVDFAIATDFKNDAFDRYDTYENIKPHEMGLDSGPQSSKRFAEVIAQAKTVLWNGPMGVFEMPAFQAGTKAVCEALVASSAYTIIGGGDSAAAAIQFGYADQIDHISTGGGASLELLEGKVLPGIAAVQDKEPS
jgi:phosphoglycerate kinase